MALSSRELTTIEDEENNYYEPDDGEGEIGDDSYPIDQFDLVSTPNDFNTKTLVDFIESGVVIIPGFQRNYVWDIKRASRLIESIIVGLPVPQVFLYEQGSNRYIVIDGQQRLMSILYFVKGRFPRKEKLLALQQISEELGSIPEDLLANSEYFTDFTLKLPENVPGKLNRFDGHKYDDLEDDPRRLFDLRTIRHVIVRQMGPKGDEAMYEIFNRLNSGGIILRPQEIRRCTFHSPFYDILYRTNNQEEWRNIVGTDRPDIHMKEVEILLRGFAMLLNRDEYSPSMVKFLNKFSQEAKSFDQPKLEQLQQLLKSFLASCQSLPQKSFHSTKGRFSPMIFESVFVATCDEPYQMKQEVNGKISSDSLERLKKDSEFRDATQSQTTAKSNVQKRLARAKLLLELA